MKAHSLIQSAGPAQHIFPATRACPISVARAWHRFLLSCTLMACACMAASAEATIKPVNFQSNPANSNDAPGLTASQQQTSTARMTDVNNTVLGLDSNSRSIRDGIQLGTMLSPAPRMQAFFPMVSLFAAVAFTHLLRRRCSAQLEALAKIEG